MEGGDRREGGVFLLWFKRLLGISLLVMGLLAPLIAGCITDAIDLVPAVC